MSLFVIGDLHLAFGAPDKSMDVFGGRWTNYIKKIEKGLSILDEKDTLVLCGDFCWAANLEQALPDFEFIHQFPGKKIFVKGNHDYWWTTANKMNHFFTEHNFSDFTILHNNSVVYEEYALCGTRGWFFEEETGAAHDEKIMKREIGRLQLSINSGGNREKIVFLHYPPLYREYECPEILKLLNDNEIHRCFYGHIHGNSGYLAACGTINNTYYRLISADFLDFIPYKITG